MPAKLRVVIIDWEYPSERVIPEAFILDLTQWKDLELLLLSFGNGTILEMRAEGDSQESIDALRGIARGTGGCEPRALTPAEQQALWLWQDGLEAHVGPAPTYVFINPTPQPL